MLKTCAKHAQNLLKTSSKHPQNILKTLAEWVFFTFLFFTFTAINTKQ